MTREATTGEGEGAGYAATKANPPPHEHKKRMAAAIELAKSSPRRIANRIPSGLANAMAALRITKTVPNELPADGLP